MKSIFNFLLALICMSASSQQAASVLNKIAYQYSRKPSLNAVFKNDSVTLFPGADYSYQIGSYSLDDFSRFLEDAWKQVLEKVSVDSVDLNNRRVKRMRLIFKEKDFIELSDRKIVLTDGFLGRLAPSTLFPKGVQNNPQHVIMIEDPHTCVNDVLVLVEALRELVPNNPGQQFALLNEGYFDTQERSIPLDPILSYLSDSLPLAYQVQKLAEYGLIDAAMAYRILYNRTIPSVAIDDPALIEEEVSYYKKVTFKQKWERPPDLYVLQESIYEKLRAKLPRLAKKVDSVFNKIHNDYLTVNLSSLNQEKERLEFILRSLSSQQVVTVTQEVASLNYYLTSTINETYYLKRDSVMSFYINRYLAEHPGIIPILFIGQAHEKGIIDRLPAATGYSVFRTSMANCNIDSSHGNLYEFSNGKRVEYITTVLQNRDRMKLPVAPLRGEGPAYRKFISDLVRRHRTLPSDPLRDACDANPALFKAEIKIVEGASEFPLPTEYSTVFGSAFGVIKSGYYGSSEVLLLRESISDMASTETFNFIKNIKLSEISYGEFFSVSHYVNPETNVHFYQIGINGGDGKLYRYLFRSRSAVNLADFYIIDHAPHVFLRLLFPNSNNIYAYGTAYQHSDQ